MASLRQQAEAHGPMGPYRNRITSSAVHIQPQREQQQQQPWNTPERTRDEVWWMIGCWYSPLQQTGASVRGWTWQNRDPVLRSTIHTPGSYTGRTLPSGRSRQDSPSAQACTLTVVKLHISQRGWKEWDVRDVVILRFWNRNCSCSGRRTCAKVFMTVVVECVATVAAQWWTGLSALHVTWCLLQQWLALMLSYWTCVQIEN